MTTPNPDPGRKPKPESERERWIRAVNERMRRNMLMVDPCGHCAYCDQPSLQAVCQSCNNAINDARETRLDDEVKQAWSGTPPCRSADELVAVLAKALGLGVEP